MSKLQKNKKGLTSLLRVSSLLVLLLATSIFTRAQNNNDVRNYRFGLSTNLPYDITYVPEYGLTSIPSVSLEIYPERGHWTFGVDGEFPFWRHPDTHRYLQIFQVTASTRRYFQEPKPDNRYRSWYLLGSVNAARYGLGFSADKGYEGEGLGLSVGIGRKCIFGRHMFIDFGVALGVFYSGYDRYVWGDDASGHYYYDYTGDPDAFRRRNQRLLWWGPTRIYLNIGFDFWNRNRTRRADNE